MTRIPQGRASKGSQRWLQEAVSSKRPVLNQAVRDALEFGPGDGITWLSLLEEDDWAEYRDLAFLDRLGIQLSSVALTEFWPQRGPGGQEFTVIRFRG